MPTEYRVTAWRNPLEWLHVYHLIFTKHDYPTALEILAVWQARSTKVAWAVPCTTNCLAAATLKTTTENEKTTSDLIIYQNTLASALTQFVGLAIEKQYKQGQFASMEYLGKSIDIPAWVIDLRHQTGHSFLPGVGALEEANDFCLNWLKESYWDPQKEKYDEDIQRLQLTSTARNALRHIIEQYFGKGDGDVNKEQSMSSRKRKVNDAKAMLVDLLPEYGRLIADYALQLVDESSADACQELLGAPIEPNMSETSRIEFLNEYFPERTYNHPLTQCKLISLKEANYKPTKNPEKHVIELDKIQIYK